MRACRLALQARRFCPASRSWSSLVRVIAPAHRDDDPAVSTRFPHRPDHARPRASRRPSAHRAARSLPGQRPQVRAHRPQHRLIPRRQGRNRARTRAPPGAAATNGTATEHRETSHQAA